jgi:hypothetical protein
MSKATGKGRTLRVRPPQIEGGNDPNPDPKIERVMAEQRDFVKELMRAHGLWYRHNVPYGNIIHLFSDPERRNRIGTVILEETRVLYALEGNWADMPPFSRMPKMQEQPEG